MGPLRSITVRSGEVHSIPSRRTRSPSSSNARSMWQVTPSIATLVSQRSVITWMHARSRPWTPPSSTRAVQCDAATRSRMRQQHCARTACRHDGGAPLTTRHSTANRPQPAALVGRARVAVWSRPGYAGRAVGSDRRDVLPIVSIHRRPPSLQRLTTHGPHAGPQSSNAVCVWGEVGADCIGGGAKRRWGADQALGGRVRMPRSLSCFRSTGVGRWSWGPFPTASSGRR